MSNIVFPVGIIDVGSNSIRLFMAYGTYSTKKSKITRLGEGLSFSSVLKNEAIERSISVISDFVSEAKSCNAGSLYIFATAAVRSASNKGDFLSRVKEKTGLDVDVVSGDLEASLAAYGALDGKTGGVIDIGGASSEIVFSDNGKIIYKHSLCEGVVKLYDRFHRDSDKIDCYVKEVLKEYGDVPKGEFFAISGAPTTLAAVDLKLKVYDRDKVHGHYMSKETLRNIKEMIKTMSPDEICKRYAVVRERAEVINGSASMLLGIVEYLGIDGITVSEHDNLEGYLYYLENK